MGRYLKKIMNVPPSQPLVNAVLACFLMPMKQLSILWLIVHVNGAALYDMRHTRSRRYRGHLISYKVDV